MTSPARDNTAALHAFMETKAEIDSLLARLQALSDEHFHASPGEVDWGHVGSLTHYASLLRQITDSAFSGGGDAG